MSSKEYIEPNLNKNYFTCPQCGKNGNQWKNFICYENGCKEFNSASNIEMSLKFMYATTCSSCHKTTIWITDYDYKNCKYIDCKIVYPEYSINKLIPKCLPEKSKFYWNKACLHYSKDWRVTMTYLRICLESILREYFNEPGTSLGNLIKKLIDDELYKSSPFSQCLNETNNFLSDSTHSTSSIDYANEPIKEDVDFVFELIEDCIYRLYECQAVIYKFKQKQIKRNQKILHQKKR